MEQIECSEKSANINQTSGKHPKDNTLNTKHGKSLKSRNAQLFHNLRNDCAFVGQSTKSKIKINNKQ
jgi:hypothetical protein